MLTGRNLLYKNLFIENIIWYISKSGPIAQSVEQRTENPCVAGSIPAWATTFVKNHKGSFLFDLIIKTI